MATNHLDAGKSNEQLLAERGKRLQDAMELKQPDRIPISAPASYLLSEYGGITHREQQDNVDLAQELLEKFALEFEPDTIMGLFNSPRPSAALGDRMTKWPGYGLPDSGSFQFDEHEFMKGEDYDAFLRDPSDWAIRTYLPRAHLRNLRASSICLRWACSPLGITTWATCRCWRLRLWFRRCKR